MLLLTPTYLTDLSKSDARTVVAVMKFRQVKAGTVFIEEGEITYTDFMVLILEGSVSVESEAASVDGGIVMSCIGPGSLIGEMGLLDGAPRSATCVAMTDLEVAVLSREAVLGLIKDNSAVAARLILAISKRLSDRLREANQNIRMLGGVNISMQQELDALRQPVASALIASDPIAPDPIAPDPIAPDPIASASVALPPEQEPLKPADLSGLNPKRIQTYPDVS